MDPDPDTHDIPTQQPDGGAALSPDGDTAQSPDGPSSSRVVLVRCDDYGQSTVDEAVDRGFQLLGGAESYVHDGERILLKPNLLVGGGSDSLISGHHTVFRAVARQLMDAGAAVMHLKIMDETPAGYIRSAIGPI